MDSDGYLLRRNPLQHGVADAVHRPTQLTFKTFLKLYLRSFFLQGSFSVKYRQNIGFAFCMEPVGRILWDDREKRKAFLLRHMEYYNGNPFMITLVIGAVAKMEEMLRSIR